MTVFWKPVRPLSAPIIDQRITKVLGRGLYELWARCDLCHGSNPFDHFVRLHKGEFTATLCEKCAADPHTVQHLVDDGWRP